MAETSRGTSENGHEDLRVLYQVTTQDLAFFKQQQWSTTNYVLLLHAGLIGVIQLTGATTATWERIAVCVLACVVGVVGVVLVAKLERSIKARRDRLGHVRARLSETFRSAWETPAKAPDSSVTALVLGSAIVVGVVIVCWVVGFRGA